MWSCRYIREVAMSLYTLLLLLEGYRKGIVGRGLRGVIKAGVTYPYTLLMLLMDTVTNSAIRYL